MNQKQNGNLAPSLVIGDTVRIVGNDALIPRRLVGTQSTVTSVYPHVQTSYVALSNRWSAYNHDLEVLG